MYCKHCGREIDDDAKFCPYCGTPVDGNNFNNNNANPYSQNSQPVVKEYNIMAILGIIFGIIGIESIIMGVSGLVFSIIGYKQAVKTGKGKGIAIAGIVISVITIIVQVVIIATDIINGSGDIDGAVYY